MENIINYGGLYGEQRDSFNDEFIHYEILTTRSAQYDWKIAPHIHSQLFQIFIIESGSLLFTHDNSSITLAQPCVITIPENTLHGFEFSPNASGKVLTFNASLVERLFKTSPNILLTLSKVQVAFAHNNEQKINEVVKIVEKINEELFDNLPERQTIIQALFSIVLTEIYRLSYSQEEDRSLAEKRNLNHYRTFKRRIKQTSFQQKSIAQYAQELNMTTIHLNRICQAVVQKTAQQTVHEHFILEAQRYLAHTSLSVSEISYLLNFEDPCYFSRFFKKNTGISPKSFRERILHQKIIG